MKRAAVMIACGLAVGDVARADEPWFIGYEDGVWMLAVSGDATVAGGRSADGALWVPLPRPPIPLEIGEIQAFVPDGSLGVGLVFAPGGQPARWSSDGTLEALGVGPLFNARAVAVSDDGSVLAGFGIEQDGSGLGAFVWTEAGGYSVLEKIPGRDRHTAHAISADGTKVFGTSSISTEPVSDALCWTRGDGGWLLATIDGLRTAVDCTPDGSVVVGQSDDGRPARWEAGRVTMIGIDDADGQANACSADGTVIVGTSTVDGQNVVWIWRAGCGAVPIADVVSALGLAPGWTFETAFLRDVAADGRTIAGIAQAPGGNPILVNGFVLHLGDHPGDTNGDGVADFTDLLAVLSAWGPCVGCPEDLDADDVVGFLDLLAVLSNWGPCG